MKAWLKGGLIGGGIGLIYSTFTFLIGILVAGGSVSRFLAFLLYPYFVIVNFWCNNFVFSKCTGDDCRCDITIPLIILIIISILIGALIGFIISKIRSKNEKS